jgi:hypothetical protein
VLFSYYHPDYASGVYFDAPWSRDLPAQTRPESTAVFCRPNPSRGPVDLILDLPGAATGSVGIYDAAGRRVRLLHYGPVSGSGLCLRWDGRADDGSRVRPGTYFVRLDSRAGRSPARLVLLE